MCDFGCSSSSAPTPRWSLTGSAVWLLAKRLLYEPKKFTRAACLQTVCLPLFCALLCSFSTHNRRQVPHAQFADLRIDDGVGLFNRVADTHHDRLGQSPAARQATRHLRYPAKIPVA